MEKLESNSEFASILRRRKQIYLAAGAPTNEEERSTIENLVYKPYQNNSYHDWTVKTTVEILDIVDKVTKAQQYEVKKS